MNQGVTGNLKGGKKEKEATNHPGSVKGHIARDLEHPGRFPSRDRGLEQDDLYVPFPPELFHETALKHWWSSNSWKIKVGLQMPIFPLELLSSG